MFHKGYYISTSSGSRFVGVLHPLSSKRPKTWLKQKPYGDREAGRARALKFIETLERRDAILKARAQGEAQC